MRGSLSYLLKTGAGEKVSQASNELLKTAGSERAVLRPTRATLGDAASLI